MFYPLFYINNKSALGLRFLLEYLDEPDLICNDLLYSQKLIYTF